MLLPFSLHLWEWQQDRRVRSTGDLTMGFVTAVENETYSRVTGAYRAFYQNIAYRFEASGQVRFGEQNYLKTNFMTGDEVEIRYSSRYSTVADDSLVSGVLHSVLIDQFILFLGPLFFIFYQYKPRFVFWKK